VFDVADIGPDLRIERRRLCLVGNQVYRLSRHFWLRPFRKYLMAISDDINAVSDTLDALATQAPPAITAAIAAAGSAGDDPNAPAAVTRLKASAAAAVAAIQGVVPAS
jgi:hypothetical protein